MSSFSYSNEEQNLFLLYNTDAQEEVNQSIVQKLIEKKREGIVKTQYITDDKGNYFKYDVNSMITLKHFLEQKIDDKTYCAILHSVAATLELLKKEDIGVCNLVLNEELIYYDSVRKVVNFICIPTANFTNAITSEMIIYEFSKLIISRMEVTSNLILEVNGYLSRGCFSSEEFNCLINSVLIMSNNTSNNKLITIREYSEDEKPAYEESAFKQVTIKTIKPAANNAVENNDKKTMMLKDFTGNAKKIIKDKVGGLSKNISTALGSVKNNINNMNSINNASMQSTYQQNIRAEVEKQREEEKQRMEDIRKNFEENRIFNNQINVAYEGGNGNNNTVIIDCVTGDVTDGNSVNTSNAYLVRESTGEKIYIDSNNFKLGRSKKFVDYYVGGNDTVSKVHAYITSDAKGYFLVDNSSRNHTFLNGKMLEPVKQMILKHKAKIKLAKEEFTFYLY